MSRISREFAVCNFLHYNMIAVPMGFPEVSAEMRCVMGFIKETKYMEEQARQTLHNICGYDISNLIRSDKPDLQDVQNGIGIEVVQDVYPDEYEALRFIESVWKIPYDQISTKKIRRFESVGGQIIHENNKIVSTTGKEKSNSPEHLIETIKGKIKKLNSPM
jgi:hypothetical protein